MKLSCKVVVTDTFKSDKSGKIYYGFVDLSTGGQFSVGSSGELQGVKPGDSLELDIEVKPGKSPKGMFLNYDGVGTVKKI